MPTSAQIKTQIDEVLAWMIGAGLSDDQNFASVREHRGATTDVTFKGAEHVSVALRSYTYDDIHARLRSTRAYSAKLLDGSLLQMTYRFVDGLIQQHRLAFFPAPNIDEVRDSLDITRDDDLYAEVSARNVLPIPLRFDYDSTAGNELEHPLSHLTLGQHTNCRIPVVAPLTPGVFVEFVMRNFYHRAFIRHESEFPERTEGFEPSILPAERDVLHIAVPRSQE